MDFLEARRIFRDLNRGEHTPKKQPEFAKAGESQLRFHPGPRLDHLPKLAPFRPLL